MKYLVERIHQPEAAPLEIEADSVTTGADGKITFYDADSNVVAQFVNINFYPAPIEE